MKTIAVIAPNIKQFEYFIREVRSQDRDQFTYIRTPSDARGKEFLTVIVIGEYWTIDHLYNLEQEIESGIRP